MPERNLKWSLHWCLTIPQGAPQLAPIGTVAVVYKNKFLFMVSFFNLLSWLNTVASLYYY